MYGINTFSSKSFLKITMMVKHAITQLKENRRNEPLKRIKSVNMSLLIYINNYAYSSTIYILKALKSNDQTTKATIAHASSVKLT